MKALLVSCDIDVKIIDALNEIHDKYLKHEKKPYTQSQNSPFFRQV